MSFENKYPYTDFHELNLDWFLQEFKKVHDHVDDLDATVKEFTDFVTNYFNNLNVQEEINNKLDQMAADGTLSALIQPLFDEYKTEIDAEVADQNSAITGQNERITALSSRMDSFVHLTDGSTTGDAELADIRVAANGTTYNTAGDAVRGQIEAMVASTASFATAVVDGSSLNTITTPGNYKVVSAASAATMTNAPITNTGYELIVLQTTTNARLYQIVLTNTGGSTDRGEIYVRNRPNDNTWTSWKKIMDQSTGLALFSSDATDIIGTSDNHVDLNSYTIPGNYKVTSATYASYIDNGPTIDVGYRLIVLENVSNNRFTQIALWNSGGTSTKMSIRNYATNGWTTWQDVPSASYVDGSFEKTIQTTNITVTSSNYLTYFPNASFNDAPLNSMIYLGYNVPLADGPEGDAYIGSTGHLDAGYIQGTLLTFRTYNATSVTPRSGLTQMIIGYRPDDYKPTLSYRIALYDNGAYVWSDWSKFEENGYVHASNKIVYAEHMDLTFDDMNDMPANSIYQLDLNLDNSDADHTLANHPAPGVSCVAMCYAFSYTTKHGKVQTVFALDGRLYWRYGYVNGPNDYRWTSWKLVASDDGIYMKNQGRLSNETDFDTIMQNGIWRLASQETALYVNTPIETGGGYLTVKWNDTIGLQTVESFAGVRYSRYTTDNGSTWSNWV